MMVKKRLSMLMVLLLVLTSISFPEKSYAAGVSKLLLGFDIDKVYVNDVQVFSSTDNTIGLVVDNEIITGEVFEDYTSHFDGETKQAYKLNAIKNGEFLQSVLLEYGRFSYYDKVSETYSHEVRLISVKPRYGPTFKENVKVLILNSALVEGIGFAKFMSGAKITLPEGIEELDPSKISEAYIYLPINELSNYTGGKI